jgi:hypothetical protein
MKATVTAKTVLERFTGPGRMGGFIGRRRRIYSCSMIL